MSFWKRFLGRNKTKKNSGDGSVEVHSGSSGQKEVNEQDINQFTYLMKQLNGGQLALLSTGIMRNLFPLPTDKSLLVETVDNGDCKIYFKYKYYSDLVDVIDCHKESGAFSNSNSEGEWLNLSTAINSAVPVPYSVDHLRPHFLSKEVIKEGDLKLQKIVFTSENRGSGPMRINEEGWSLWLSLNGGTFREDNNSIKLTSLDGRSLKVNKNDNLMATKTMNRFLSVDERNFVVFEGSMPGGGHFTLYRFKDKSRGNEYFLATPGGIANGSVVAITVK